MLSVETYSDKSVVVRGEYDQWIADLRKVGGLDNKNLKGGRGFIVSKKKQCEIQELVDRINKFSNGESCSKPHVLKHQKMCYNVVVPEVGYEVSISSPGEGVHTGTISSVCKGTPVMEFTIDKEYKVNLVNGKWLLNGDKDYDIFFM
ncbi:MAG: hypothetical protein QM487_04145 [Candidatus Marithrix sp.]